MTNYAISLTPIAAEYRTALGITYLPMLLEALVGGLIIGFCVAYCLLRFFDKLPTKSPILKSLVLSVIALILVTPLELPAKTVMTTDDTLRYFVIAAGINALRIPALGVVVGYLYGRINGRVKE